MARKKNASRNGTLSLVEIEQLLESRQAELSELQSRRDELTAELDSVDAEIQGIEGGGRPGRKPGRRKKAGGKKTARKRVGKRAGGRRRGGQNVEDAIRGVMSKAKGPMKLAEIATGVVKSGYKTLSQRFSVIVNQRLAKMPGVKRVQRGVYRLR